MARSLDSSIRISRIVGLTAVVLLGAAACTTADHSASVEPASVSVDAGTVTVASQALLTSVAETSAVTTGRFDLSTSVRGRVGAVAVNGEFDRGAGTARVAARADGGSGPLSLEVRVIGGTVYLDAHALDGVLGDMLGLETPWISIDASKLAAGNDLGIDLPGTDAGSDPASLLDLLRGVSGEVTDLGQEDVRGIPTTHYRAEVIPAKALEDLSAERQDQLRKLLGTRLDTPIPVEVWIDDAGLVRKAILSYGGDQAGQAVTVTFELFDLGQPVSITEPPADQVTAAESLPILKGLLGD